MKSDYEYKLVTSFIRTKAGVTLATEGSERSLGFDLDKHLVDIIGDAEGSYREATFEIVSHSLLQADDGFLLSVLFRLKNL